MKVYRITCLEDIPSRDARPGCSFLALGNFDGLHAGHCAILQAARMGAWELGVHPGVFTFATGKAALLTTLSERLKLMEAAGMETVWLADFDALKGQSPEAFVSSTLTGLGAVGVSCGFNFRFGQGAAGDVRLLTALSESHGIACTVVPPVMKAGVTVSSTEIRRRLREGDLAGVSTLLGRPWSIIETVAHGRAVGGKVLASPTLNLHVSKDRLLPPFGVYFTECVMEGITYPAITNLGIRPTFGASEVLCETHLIGASGNFYGKEAEVRFLAFHRAERRFSSADELAQTIASDITAARRYHGVKADLIYSIKEST